jgi:hypothetical protein
LSCPDWQGLAALRGEPAGPFEPAASAASAKWADAVAHLDGCQRCRREALAADPLLVFRRLPALQLGEAAERSEVESMRQAVAAMRTGRRLESRHRFAGWRRWAAAAALVVASFAVSRDPSPVVAVSAPLPAPAAPPQEAVGARFEGTPEMLEGLDRPDARVYQMKGKDMAVVMIVDKSFDV